ncbi:kelch-like protein 21 [Glandiceps talaboti]
MATASGTDEKQLNLGETVDYTETNHPVHLIKGLNELRSLELFTDITLEVGSKEYPCHKAVLASCSPYFRAMFTNDMKERNANRVQIKDVQVDVMNVIIQFIYTGKITISPQNVQAVFEGASLLQVHTVQDVCAGYFERLLSPSNCLGILDYADTHGCKELQQKAWKVILNNFNEVCKSEEFLLLPKDQLIEILASDLSIDREEQVCEAIIGWVNYDRTSREIFLSDLVAHVRLPFLSPAYLGKAANDPLLRQVHLGAEKDKMLERTRTYYAKSREKAVTNLSANKPRNYTQVLLTVGGEDENLRPANCIWCYDPVKNKWSYLYELPDELFDWDLAVASFGTDIFVAGKRPLASSPPPPSFPAWIYKGVNQRWMKVLLPPNLEVAEFAVTSDDSGILYLLGGYDYNMRNVASARRYIVATNTWDEIAPMLMSVSNLSATICEGKVYAIGGYTGVEDTAVIQCYDPKIDKWNYVKSLPMTVRDAVALTMNGRIYLLAGVAKSLVYCYDPQTDKWTQLQGMAHEVFMYGATVCNSAICAVGGYFGDYFAIEVNKMIQQYDTEEDRWTAAESMPNGLHSLRCTTMYRFAALGT